MATREVGTTEIGGEEVTVNFMLSNGMFYITHGGDEVGSGDTLEKAKRNAAAALRKRRVKVSVPFALHDGRRGVADGIHQRNRSVLSSIDGAREELGYNTKALAPEIPEDVLQRIGEIDEATRTLQRERGGIVREYEFDLLRAVKVAIQDKIDEEDATKAGAAAHG